MSVPPSIRVCTLNILAPELMLFFWRSSYGLPLLSSDAAYDAVTALRMKNIIDLVSALNPAILCLQEVTDTRVQTLEWHPVAEFIAAKCGFKIAGRSYKGSEMSWAYPPQEQNRGSPKRLDSGVATLYKPEVVRHLGQVSKAETHGPSALFNTGYGSPFSLDKFEVLGGSGGGGGGGGRKGTPTPLTFNVANIHVRMIYPNILKPMTELLQRIRASLPTPVPATASPWERLILAGDFNSGSREANLDWKNILSVQTHLTDLPLAGEVGGGGGGGGGLSPSRHDHIILGPSLQAQGQVAHASTAPLLDTDSQPAGVPSSSPKHWGVEGTPYTLHKANTELLGGFCTSDHPAIYCDLVFTPLAF